MLRKTQHYLTKITNKKKEAMNINEALLSRKSVRAYLQKEVSKEKIEAILTSARHAPSGTNAQPWKVAVVAGEIKDKLTSALVTAFNEQGHGEMDYQYYPLEWKDEYKRRRVETGAQLYKELGIERHDKKRRREQWLANYRAFDAPVILFFFLDPTMQAGSYLDYGMFWQSIMLAAVREGLATCPQAALGQFPKITKKTLGYDDEIVLLGGSALGYEDTTAKVNQYRTPREEISTFTRFFGI